MELSFLGAAGTVTGSRTLVSGAGGRVLVDCGMFQGYKALRERNWGPLPLRGHEVDAVLLTHAHLDHSGWVPALVSGGFRGPIYCTPGTADLLAVLLTDSGRIQEEDAAYANRKGYARHDPALPLYTEADAERALRQLVRVPWGEEVEIAGFRATWSPVGHILGASCVRVQDADTSVLFSGDVGRQRDLVMKPPAPPLQAEHLVLESTYGGRLHDDHDLMDALEPVVRRTVDRGGVLLVPSFAVGRAQAVLWALHRLREAGRIPDVPVVLDSPMAVDATELYLRHSGSLRLDPGDVSAMCRASRFVQTQQESQALNRQPGPFVLVSASGMLTGGRVLHHLAARAPHRENTLLFVGYQSPGTRGGRILAGERELKIHGRYVEVACEVTSIDGFSAHADQGELIEWLRGFDKPPRATWLNHGEPESADALRVRIQEALGWDVRVATEGRTLQLPLGAESLPPAQRRRAPAPWAALDARAQGPLRYVLEHAAIESALAEERVQDVLLVLGAPGVAAGEGGADSVGLSSRSLPAWAWARAADIGRIVAAEAPGLVLATVEATGVAESARLAAQAHRGRTLYLGPEASPPPRGVDASLSLQASDRALGAQVLEGRVRAVVALPGGVETLAVLLDLLDRPRPAGPLPVVLVGADWWDDVLDLDPLGAAALDATGSGRIFRVGDSRSAWEALAPLLLPGG